MSTTSEYGIAYQRLEDLQAKKKAFYRLLIVSIVLVGLCWVGDIKIFYAFLPIIIPLVFLNAYRGLQVYQAVHLYTPSKQLTELEMSWLFGDDWQSTATFQEYAVAQDRIRQRRYDRWVFLMHLLTFMTDYCLNYGGDDSLWIVITTVWPLVLLYHIFQAFPPPSLLERRERKAGEELRREIEAMQPEKSKRKMHYILADDGEMVEMQGNSPATEDNADTWKWSNI